MRILPPLKKSKTRLKRTQKRQVLSFATTSNKSLRKLVIEPRSFWKMADFLDLIEFRWVLFMLIVRDIKLRYKETYLGVFWVLFQPFTMAALTATLFGKWMHFSSGGYPYLLFALCGLIPWLVFSQSLQRGGFSLINESHLIQKVYFPRIFLPLSATLGMVLDFFIMLCFYGAAHLFYGISPSKHLSFLPICALHVFLFSSAASVLLSALTVRYRDFKHLIPFLLQIWIYLSPVVYATEIVPKRWSPLYCLNPLVGVIDGFRWSLLGEGAFPALSFSYSFITTVVMLFIGLFLFRKLERSFSDVL